MKNRIVGILASAVFATFGTATLASCDSGEVVMRFSHTNGLKLHPRGLTAELLALRVNAEMDDTACLEIFPNSILYRDTKVIEAIQQGDIQFAAPPTGVLEEKAPSLSVMNLPFLFKNIDAFLEFEDQHYFDRVDAELAEHDLKILAFWHNGFRQLISKQPMYEPADLSGETVVTSDSRMNKLMFELLGSNVVTSPIIEIPETMAGDQVSAHENTWSNIFDMGLETSANNVLETNHSILEYVLVTRKSWYENLPAGTLKKFENILSEVSSERNQTIFYLNSVAKDKLLEKNIQITDISDNDRLRWVFQLQPFRSSMSKDLPIDFLMQINEVNARN